MTEAIYSEGKFGRLSLSVQNWMRLTGVDFPGVPWWVYASDEKRCIQDVYAAIEEPLHFPLWPEACELDKRNSQQSLYPRLRPLLSPFSPSLAALYRRRDSYRRAHRSWCTINQQTARWVYWGCTFSPDLSARDTVYSGEESLEFGYFYSIRNGFNLCSLNCDTAWYM